MFYFPGLLALLLLAATRAQGQQPLQPSPAESGAACGTMAPAGCGSHGNCTASKDDKSVQACNCSAGWAGHACEIDSSLPAMPRKELPATCGNGGLEAPNEVCDGAQIGSQTCAGLGFEGGGILLCQPDCLAFNTSACSNVSRQTACLASCFNGACLNGECVCASGWKGSDCTTPRVYNQPQLLVLLGFLIISTAAWTIGRHCPSWLPLITGYIFTGILAGPHVLNLIPESQIRSLDFIDHVALAVIAMASGAKFQLAELRGRLTAVFTIAICLVLIDWGLGTVALFLFSRTLEFLANVPRPGRWGVGMLMGTLLAARSPSSAIAIVNELHAKGPFTALVLGVTVVMDVLVIVFFSINMIFASALLDLTHEVPSKVLGLSVFRLTASLAAGAVMGKVVLPFCLWSWVCLCHLQPRYLQALQVALFLVMVYGVFVLEPYAKDILEPLVLCMAAGFTVANFTPHRAAFLQLMHVVSPIVFVGFFTLTGAALDLYTLTNTVAVSIALFLVRLLGVATATYMGGRLTGEPPAHNRIAWMAYVTQAGVALGLAKQVHLAFPEWGSGFATLVVSVVVMNQLLGPPLFKHAIRLVGEAREAPRKKLGSGGHVLLISSGQHQPPFPTVPPPSRPASSSSSTSSSAPSSPSARLPLRRRQRAERQNSEESDGTDRQAGEIAQLVALLQAAKWSVETCTLREAAEQRADVDSSPQPADEDSSSQRADVDSSSVTFHVGQSGADSGGPAAPSQPANPASPAAEQPASPDMELLELLAELPPWTDAFLLLLHDPNTARRVACALSEWFPNAVLLVRVPATCLSRPRDKGWLELAKQVPPRVLFVDAASSSAFLMLEAVLARGALCCRQQLAGRASSAARSPLEPARPLQASPGIQEHSSGALPPASRPLRGLLTALASLRPSTYKYKGLGSESEHDAGHVSSPVSAGHVSSSSPGSPRVFFSSSHQAAPHGQNDSGGAQPPRAEQASWAGGGEEDVVEQQQQQAKEAGGDSEQTEGSRQAAQSALRYQEGGQQDADGLGGDTEAKEAASPAQLQAEADTSQQRMASPSSPVPTPSPTFASPRLSPSSAWAGLRHGSMQRQPASLTPQPSLARAPSVRRDADGVPL
eukprot:g62158.t1